MQLPHKFLPIALSAAIAITGVTGLALAKEITGKVSGDGTQISADANAANTGAQKGGKQCGGGHHKGGFKGGHGKMDPAKMEARKAEMKQKFATELGLTADQQKKLDAIHASYGEKRKAHFEQMRKDGAADRAAIEKQVNAVLTPDQQKKLATMKAEGKKRFEERRKNGGPGGPGGRGPGGPNGPPPQD